MASRKLFLGRHAKISVMARFVHPSAHIRTKFPNLDKNQRLDNCAVLRQEEKFVSRKRQLCIIFSSPDFPDEELHADQRYCKVTQEGPRDLFFSLPTLLPCRMME